MSWFRKSSRLILVIFAALTLILEVAYFAQSSLGIYFVLSLTSLFILFGISFYMERGAGSRKSFYIAVVGRSHSGKTTLIISLFGEAFARRLPVRAVPRGSQTIDLINKSLELLNKGKALGPTMDKDRYGFRADVTKSDFLFRSTYRLEFGDFPGKYSEELSTDNLPTVNDEYSKWIAESDAIMFIIDVARYLGPNSKSFIAEETSYFRAKWQKYIDTNSYRLKQVRSHPVLIVFTKTDILFRTFKYHSLSENPEVIHIFEQKVAEFGFGDNVPPVIKIDDDDFLLTQEAKIERDFSELIEFFRAEAPNTAVIFTSSFGLHKDEKLGFSEIFSALLKNA